MGVIKKIKNPLFQKYQAYQEAWAQHELKMEEWKKSSTQIEKVFHGKKVEQCLVAASPSSSLYAGKEGWTEFVWEDEFTPTDFMGNQWELTGKFEEIWSERKVSAPEPKEPDISNPFHIRAKNALVRDALKSLVEKSQLDESLCGMEFENSFSLEVGRRIIERRMKHDLLVRKEIIVSGLEEEVISVFVKVFVSLHVIVGDQDAGIGSGGFLSLHGEQ